MSQSDPYAPPLAELGGQTPNERDGALRYSGFWERVVAYLIDFLILSPIIALDYFFGGETRMYQLYALVPTQLISVFLFIFMVVKYGGTPGKLALGLRIVKVDGSPVTVQTALLRYGVLWALSMAMVIVTIMSAMNMTDEAYRSFGYMERSVQLSAGAPLLTPITVLMQLWIFGSFIAILANKKRRTLHDFVAGTVVVRK